MIGIIIGVLTTLGLVVDFGDAPDASSDTTGDGAGNASDDFLDEPVTAQDTADIVADAQAAENAESFDFGDAAPISTQDAPQAEPLTDFDDTQPATETATQTGGNIWGSWEDTVPEWDNGQDIYDTDDTDWEEPSFDGPEWDIDADPSDDDPTDNEMAAIMAETVEGDDNNNFLSGIAGDTLTGNGGRDVFEVIDFERGDTGVTITDFSQDDGEAILITSLKNIAFEDILQIPTDDGLVLSHNGDQLAVVQGVQSLSADQLIIMGFF